MNRAGHHDPQTVTASIDDSAGGTWLVTTETGSRYQLNLQRRTLRREPGGGPLRSDGRAVALHQILECRVGASAGFLISVEPGVLTLRLTSHVVNIQATP